MKLFRSIKWQLLVWQSLLLAGVLTTLLMLHYQFHQRDLITELDNELQEMFLTIMPTLAQPPQDGPGRRGPGRRMQDPRERETREQPQQELKTNEKNQQKNITIPSLDQTDFYILIESPQGIQCFGTPPFATNNLTTLNISSSERRIRNGCRELVQLHRDEHGLIIGHPLDAIYAEMKSLRSTLILMGSGTLLACVSVGWLMIHRALRPILTISRTAKTITTGAHHERIELADAPEELASLAQTLNGSFDHLDESIQIQKRFSADASHELRTPIAVVIAQAEAALNRDRTTDEYKNVLHACLRAGLRMKSMTNSLLELTQLDRIAEMQPQPCDLNQTLSDAADSASLLSNKHPVTLLPLAHPLEVMIDPERVHQVLMNLLTNAMTHNPNGCAINIKLDRNESDAIITIEDSGKGIPAEALPHIFDRFFRVDDSRSRANGGAGLGLSIVQKLIETQHGQITASSAPGQGATFTITFPLKT